MGPLLLFFALPSEATPFLRAAARRGVPLRRTPPKPRLEGVVRFVGPGMEVWVTGVGPANAVRAAEAALAGFRPELAVTSGIAGALRPDLRIGEVIHEADEIPDLEPALRRHGSRPGRIATRDRVAVLAQEKANIRGETGADLVEMESGAIRERCKAAGVPSATIRSVSDLAEGDLPLDFNRVYDSRMALSPWRLAGAIAVRPTSIPGLMRLGRDANRASEELSRVLDGVLFPP